MLLASFWVLDYTIIAIVVNATQTGSFMDGFATLINCKTDRGNPWQTTTVSPYPWCICTSSPWSAIFLPKAWLNNNERDVPSAFSSLYTLRYTPLSTLDCSHGTSRQRCRGHLGPQMQWMHHQLGRSCAICSPNPGRAQIYADLLPKHSTHLPLLSAQYHLQEPHGMVEIHLSWSFNLRQSRLCISDHFLPVEDRLLAKLPMRRLWAFLV